jgi:hypothetical protein
MHRDPVRDRIPAASLRVCLRIEQADAQKPLGAIAKGPPSAIAECPALGAIAKGPPSAIAECPALRHHQTPPPAKTMKGRPARLSGPGDAAGDAATSAGGLR